MKYCDYMQLIYKIEDKTVWNDALSEGFYHGAPIDLRDGFIHFSTAEQVRETAARHFAGRENLIIAAVEANLLEPDLKWEISRGGALFPHYYGVLNVKAVIKTHDLPLNTSGNHVIDDDIR